MLEKYFSYYKGETENPFPEFSNEWHFWSFEQQIASQNSKNTENVGISKGEKMLMEQAEEYTKNFLAKKERGEELTPLQLRFLSYSKGKRALAVRLGWLLQKFNPYDCDELLLEY